MASPSQKPGIGRNTATKLSYIHNCQSDFRYLQLHLDREIPSPRLQDYSLLSRRSLTLRGGVGVAVGNPNVSLKNLAKGVLKNKRSQHNPVEDVRLAMGE